ncbi:probable flavin-containing monooxygenase 1 [Magnolia sinica]|uniref:probable flavin-containing monooxygenase 1 n=1 Tax=Magnolia sinica TaxID=86752 RepID=UPI0026592D65|nr:probable flavin-containing monooxygenase 1 [Magnolia sinica]
MATMQNRRLGSRVAIIGAGISGIAAAKQLAVHKPVVFEASDSIGGVWKHCSYESTKLQTPRRDYEFSDYPWPDRDNSTFPTYIEILEYLHGYATQFDLLKYVQFNSKVVEVRFVGEPESTGSDGRWGLHGRPLAGQPVWEVAVKTNGSDTIQWYAFEFVVVCIGKYGDEPRMPNFPHNKGPETFRGKVMHSLDYCKLDKKESTELMKGKKVVVIGYKKSAIDLALECAEANQGEGGQPCTIVVRTLHWVVPSYSIWGLPFFLFYSTRSSQFLHQRPNQSFLRDLFCHLSSPMRRAVSRFIESYLAWKLPLKKYGLLPDHPFEEDYASCQMAILPENFFPEADKGRILFKRASKWWFWEGGIEFEDNTKLEADVVFLATGFDGKRKLKSILPEPFGDLIENSSGVMPLYRGTIHPLIPHMAFVGYLESVSNLQTAELRCIWLGRLLDEQFMLPNVEKMISQTNEEVEVMKRTTRFYKRQCISTYSINHSDEICEEMGWTSWRKESWFSEVFSAYTSQDYKEEK